VIAVGPKQDLATDLGPAKKAEGTTPAFDSKSFISLQCMRGLAAALVVLAHLPHGIPHSINGAIRGGIGVDLFFVISGFVMAHTLVARAQNPLAALAFLLRRILRIYPLYFLATVFTAVVMLIQTGASIDWIYLFKSVTAVPLSDAKGDYLSPMLFLGWTLSFEMFFYLVLGVLIGFGVANWKVLGAILLALVAAGQIVPPTSVIFSFISAPIILEFGAGFAVYALWCSHYDFIIRHSRLLLIVGGLFFLVALKGFDGDPHGLMPRMIVSFWGQAPMSRFFAWGLPSLVLFLGLLSLEPWLQARKVHWLYTAVGDASYSLYLFHFVIMGLLTPLIGTGSFLVTFPYFVITIGLALLIYRFLELPLLRLSKLLIPRALSA
jgi:peptidoglycan/LPS O-acetylase OafA/YrhL